MNYTQVTGEKSTVNLTINFTENEWKDAIARAYVKGRGKYAVPGFRKGKAPQAVLQNYYGKSLFYEDALNLLFSENYYGILDKEKENFTAVGEPELSLDEIKEGEGVTIKAAVPVKPELTLETYTGLKIKKYEYNVTDGEVENEVKKLGTADAKDVEVTDRPCKTGDRVNIDFSGSVDGEKFAGGTAESYELELGSGSFIPGFEDQVCGMSCGENRDITVKFPDDYNAENLRGKDAVFAIKLNAIHAKEYPELTDEYVKAHSGSETLADYKDKVRARLERQAEGKARDDTENSILSEISSHASAEIPDAMVEGEIDNMVRDFAYRLSYQGIKLDEYVKYMGITMEAFRAQFRDQAHTRVLNQLVIEKIVKAEKIEASENEVKDMVTKQAESLGKSYEEYSKTIDPRQLEYIKNDVIITKLFDFLKSNNELYL